MWSFQQTTDFLFNSFYTNGGLKDIRLMREGFAAKDPVQPIGVGVAMVFEAWLMGTAADIFGDVPYSKAVQDTIPSPVPFDTQVDIYNHVIALLDSAVANLAGGGQFSGVDLAYPGSSPDVVAAAYTAVAHTLKARFLMHNSKSPGVDANANYQAALLETASGITSPAGNYFAKHDGTAGSYNLTWGSIGNGGDRNSDTGTPGAMIEGMKARGDTLLLALYFTPVDSAGKSTYVGTDITSRPSIPGVSAFSNFAMNGATPTPLITYAENQLIAAEAQFRLGQQAAALATLNAVRATYFERPLSVSGNQILQEVLFEKYVQAFLTPEPYFDYNRTCWPNLRMPPDRQQNFIPGRLFVGTTEASTNPTTPPQGDHNANNPKNTVSLDGSQCVGQVGRSG